MGYPPIHKVDPNTGDTAIPQPTDREKLGQSAIPAALATVAKFAASERGFDLLAQGPHSQDWIPEMLGTPHPDIITQIARYAGTDPSTAKQAFEEAIHQGIHMGNHVQDAQDPKPARKKFYADLLTTALTYLPSAIKVGDSLDDNTLDDNTHRMEGPLSNIAHAIEKTFSDVRTDHPKQEQ